MANLIISLSDDLLSIDEEQSNEAIIPYFVFKRMEQVAGPFNEYEEAEAWIDKKIEELTAKENYRPSELLGYFVDFAKDYWDDPEL